jgi:hypothetical protein
MRGLFQMIHHVTAEFVCVRACIMPEVGYEKWDIKSAFREPRRKNYSFMLVFTF